MVSGNVVTCFIQVTCIETLIRRFDTCGSKRFRRKVKPEIYHSKRKALKQCHDMWVLQFVGLRMSMVSPKKYYHDSEPIS